MKLGGIVCEMGSLEVKSRCLCENYCVVQEIFGDMQV